MDLSRQVREIRNTLDYYENIDEISYECTINDKDFNLVNCHLKKGNITILVDALGIGSNSMKSRIDIVFLQNEPITEFVRYNIEYDLEDNLLPVCIVSEKLKNQLHIQNDNLYFNVSGNDYKVIGWVAVKNLINNYDRVIIKNVPEKDVYKLCCGKNVTIKYSSNDKLTEEDKMSFKKWVEEVADISEMEREIPTDMERYISKKSFNRFLNYYKIIYAIIILFCFFNISFLAYAWGRKRLFNLTIKRTLGFNFFRLLFDVFKEFVIYELISTLLVIIGSFGLEFAADRMVVWVENIQTGYLLGVIVMICFGIVLSALSLIWVYKYKPIEGLKLAEQ